MAGYSVPLVFLVLGLLSVFIFSPHFYSTLPLKIHEIWDYLPKQSVQSENKVIQGDNKQSVEETSNSLMFTKEELWKDYRGEKGSKGLHLAFFGKVYDVSKGKEYYEPGGGYHFFAGRDGTRGFVTGDFTDDGLTDDLTGLDTSFYGGFQEWLDFYDNTYTFKGYLVGRFYDSNGNPTEALEAARKEIDAAKVAQDRVKEDQRKYPMCNSESSSQGSRVWCSKKRLDESDYTETRHRTHLFMFAAEASNGNGLEFHVNIMPPDLLPLDVPASGPQVPPQMVLIQELTVVTLTIH